MTKLCYQAATPDVAIADSVTAYQGPLARTFGDPDALGYDGVELMTLNPGKLDREEVEETAEEGNPSVVLTCIGETFGQLGLDYTHPSRSIRRGAVERTKEIIDFAGYLGVNVDIGRIRGQCCGELDREETSGLAQSVFAELADYAAPRKVDIAPKTVVIVQTSSINTLTEGAAMVDWVRRPNFHLVMDIFHLNLEEKDLYEAVHAYSSYNIHVHLADNNRRYPGQCGLDFGKILTVLRECGYDGNCCTEIFQLPSMKETVRESVRYLRPIADRVYGRSARYSQISRNRDDSGKNRKEGIQIQERNERKHFKSCALHSAAS